MTRQQHNRPLSSDDRPDAATLRHLDVLRDASRGGEVVADAHVRLDADQFRSAVADAAARFAAAGVGPVTWWPPC